MSNVLGILGGMGPLASAEFVKTIYESNLTQHEQEMPHCILFSDPSIPDRTEAILRGDEAEIIARLNHALLRLTQLDVARIVIPCITAHHFLPLLRPDLRAAVLSLIDVVINDLLRARQPHLLFCTNGTRRARILERDPRWSEVARYVVLPTEADQQRIHALLYGIKQGHVGDAQRDEVKRLLAHYDVRGLIAGCSELHLLTKRMATHPTMENVRIADPLLTIARRVPEILKA
jgi:aspartate racemase